MTEQEFQELVRFLEETPESIRQSALRLAATDLRRKPSAAEFSVIEQVCHLRDIEREGYAARIRRLLTEDEPQLPDIDGSRLARERAYNSQDFETAFQEFARAREENVRLMKTLSPERLERTGILEGVGPITLGKLFRLMREHDEAHRRELSDLRREWAAGEKN
jgi:Ni,Fe-hydrogenase III large subunit